MNDTNTTNGKTRNTLTRMIDQGLEGALDTIATYPAKLTEDAAYAFEGGDKAVEAAAIIDVFRTVKGFLDRDLPTASIVEHIRKQVLRSALYPPSSKSAMSDLVNHYKGKAWSKLAKVCDE